MSSCSILGHQVHAVVQAAHVAQLAAAVVLGHLHRPGDQRGRPLDRDRIAVHRGRLSTVACREHLPVDPRFEDPIHGVHEVVAVELGVEAQDAAAEQAIEQFGAPGADREGLRVRPGDVPEGDHRGLRQPFADHARQQREMVVLHQQDRVGRAGLLRHRVGELAVHVVVVLPVTGAEYRPHVGDVAQRPETLVGETVVIACLLLGGEPHPPEPVARMLRRHPDPVARVDYLPVGLSRPSPCSRARVPCTQPRQLISAMTTVIRATIRQSATKK